MKRRLGSEGDVLSRPADFPAHLRRLEGDESPLASLIRLFVVLASESAATADRVLAPLGSAGLARLGLVRRDGDRLVASVRLVPHDDLVIASDLSESDAGADHVPGVQRPSRTLASLTIRRPAARALDLCTGNGIQALLAARHAGRVVATDVNERALAFARFNLGLNGAENVELRRGSFFEPVAGERFELIVANPPYVISPETSLVFRDSGLGRDRVSEELVRALPAHLEEGGLATIMVSWIQSGEDPAARPRRWLERSGCDAWILHTGSDDPLGAAAGWNRGVASAEERADAIDRWLEYFRAEGIEAIAYGTLVLRRRTARENWVEATELPHGGFGSASAALERMLAAQDFLEGTGDEQLLASRLRVADDVTLGQRLGREDGGWTLRESELRLEDGLRFVAGLDASSARIVAGLDPSRPLRASLEEAATDLEADREEFVAAGAALLRRMLALGFVVPENGEGAALAAPSGPR